MVKQKIKPSNFKYDTSHRSLVGNNFNIKNSFNLIIRKDSYNSLYSVEQGHITNNQLNAAVLIIKKMLKQQGKLDYFVFPNRPVSKRPLELTLGRGKAAVNHWTTFVKPGTLIFRISGDNSIINKQSLYKASKKFNILTKVI